MSTDPERSATSGVFVALFAAPPVDMGPLNEYGTRFGLYVTCISFGALAGPPISGAINQNTGGFKYVGVYAGMSLLRMAAQERYERFASGSTIMASVALFLLTKYMKLGTLRGKA